MLKIDIYWNLRAAIGSAVACGVSALGFRNLLALL
jgi:hypothetical protein